MFLGQHVMETPNRRESYRFSFGYLLRPRAELLAVGNSPDGVRLGVLLDLSMDGAGLLLPECIPCGHWDADWLLRFTLTDRRGKPLPLEFPCRVRHGHARREGHVCGLCFVSTGTASFEQGRRLLWRYLLEQQSLSRHRRPVEGQENLP